MEKSTTYKFIFIGYVFFVLAVFFSYLLLKITEMKYYTVVMSLSYISVLFASKIFLNEDLNRQKVIGTFLIAFGIVVFLYK